MKNVIETVNGIEIEVDDFYEIQNFGDIEELEEMGLEFEDGVAFENNDGMMPLTAIIYKVKNCDNSICNAVGVNNKTGSLHLCDYDVEMGLNECTAN